MSLAMSVLDIVSREMKRHPGAKLRKILLEIGEQAGVERQSFDVAIEAVIGSSAYAGARIEVATPQAVAECLDCGHRFHPSDYHPCCPRCGSAVCGIVSGREFRILELTIDN